MAEMLLLLLITVLVSISTVHSRPHKIHGLLLYPDKKAWCETKDIEMVITHPDCKPKDVSNRVCVGQCFSYITPRTNPPNQAEEKLKYCDQCRPSNTTWKQITLQCPESNLYRTFTKEVEIIQDCSCQTCVQELTHQTNENNADSTEDDLLGEFESDERLSQEEYMAQARHKLAGEDQGVVVGSREDLERHGRNKHARKNWLERRYRNLDQSTSN